MVVKNISPGNKKFSDVSVDTGIFATNFLSCKPKIVLRRDSFDSEVGILAGDLAIYVKKEDFSKLISKMLEFYLNFASTVDIALLLNKIHMLYFKKVKELRGDG